MEEERKKKRNKRKKTKQSKAAEDIAVDAEETTSLDQNHVSNGQDNNGQVSETADAHNDVQNMNVDLNGHRPNGTEGSILVEAERQQWLQREATLEETIKQLRSENDLHIKKEVSLEETVKVLQNETESHIQKEAGLEMIIVQLRNEKEESNLMLCYMQARWEEKISQLLDEKSNLGLKGASLEEKVKHFEREKDFWILKENSTKETIANLNGDVAKLQVQVVELEEFRSNLLQENRRLMDIISGLQLQTRILRGVPPLRAHQLELKKHAAEHEDLNSQMEAALALVEKLIAENAELVEKVNELYVELDRRSAPAELPSATGSDPMVETTETASVADPRLNPTRICL